jgi:uncharacterized protein
MRKSRPAPSIVPRRRHGNDRQTIPVAGRVEPNTVVFLTFLIFAAALLYSSVGHAGASGYLAAMALFGVAPAVMKPTALALNILVAAIAFTMFYRAGCFSWTIFRPFALGAVPFAFIGGFVALPGAVYRAVVGAVLLYAAVRLFLATRRPQPDITPLPFIPAVALGIVIGFLSGLTGVGGGIFLSPLLLFLRWAEVRVISGIAAAFILLNSIAGLLGVIRVAPELPAALPLWAVAAVAGGFLGAELGSRRLGNTGIQRALALVLAVAGVKMIATA